MPLEPSRGISLTTLARSLEARLGSMAFKAYSSCLPWVFNSPDSRAAAQGWARSLMLSQRAYSRYGSSVLAFSPVAPACPLTPTLSPGGGEGEEACPLTPTVSAGVGE